MPQFEGVTLVGLDPGEVFIRVKSHRARHKMEQVLGELPQSYFSFHKSGDTYVITTEQWEKIQAPYGPGSRAIKGISKARLRPEDRWMKRMKWTNPDKLKTKLLR